MAYNFERVDLWTMQLPEVIKSMTGSTEMQIVRVETQVARSFPDHRLDGDGKHENIAD